MSPMTQSLASTMLTSEHRYACIKAAQRCHRACDQHLTYPSPVHAQEALLAFDALLGLCLRFADPIAVKDDAVDLRDLAQLLDPRG